MQMESLKVFCDVARHRSFSLAAVANDMTQSAVSQVVSQLEKRMTVQLVDRSTRPLQLTALGQRYYEGCKTLLEQYAELEASIRSAQADVTGSVQVAAIYSVGLGDMGQYVQRFTAEAPGSQVSIEYLHPDQVVERVLDGTADLGLVSFPRRSPKLTAVPWKDEPMVLVCPPRHPFATQLAVSPKDLDGQKYVHFARALTIRREVDRFLREHNTAVDVALEFDTVENIKQAVALGAGVALLPEPTVRRETKTRTLVALPLYGVQLTRPLGIIHRRRPPLSVAAARFLELLRADAGADPRRNGDIATLAGGNVPPAPTKESARGRNGSARAAKRSIGS